MADRLPSPATGADPTGAGHRRLLSIQSVRDGGGSEKALIRMVRELGDAGWECHVALPSKPTLEEEYLAAGAVLHYVPMERLTLSGSRVAWAARYGLRWPVTAWRLMRLARRVDAAVVHTNSLHSLHGWAAALLAGRPHVWHAREIVAQSGGALRLERALAGRYATTVVAISSAVASQLEDANLVVAYDLPDPREFHPARAGRFRSGAGLPDTKLLIGAAGRIDTWKGFDVLLDAYELLRSAHPEVGLVIAGGAVGGKETYAEGLEARARALGVTWLGARHDIPDVMADLDVFAQLSTLPEPFGLGVVEALWSGCPVVATETGGPAEIIGALPGGGGGCLVPAGDAGQTAAALRGLLPPTTSSAQRAARPPLVPALPEGPSFAEIFDAAAGAPPCHLLGR